MTEKKFSKKALLLTTLLAVSVGFNFFLFGKTIDWQNKDLYFNKAVPDIELGGVMLFYGTPTLTGEVFQKPYEGAYGYGEITGFVAFNDVSQQPRGTQQYYTILSSDQVDENGNQIFYLIQTIKMSSIPPRELEPEELYVTDDNSRVLTLETSGGAKIEFFKTNRTVLLDDGEAKLITSDFDYKDFMIEFYD